MASMLATEKAAPTVTPCSLHLRSTELASPHLGGALTDTNRLIVQTTGVKNSRHPSVVMMQMCVACNALVGSAVQVIG